MKYYDLKKNWTNEILPHLGNRELREILVYNFNRYTYGKWRVKFTNEHFPSDFDRINWRREQKGRKPRYWQYVCSHTCHFLVNFTLRLAQLVEPGREWRILTSDKHSTVWDGQDLLFDLNYFAFGVPAKECFDLANDEMLPIGKSLSIGMAKYHLCDVIKQVNPHKFK